MMNSICFVALVSAFWMGDGEIEVLLQQPPDCSNGAESITSTDGWNFTADDFVFSMPTRLTKVEFYFPEFYALVGISFVHLRVWRSDETGEFPLSPPLFSSGHHTLDDEIVSVNIKSECPDQPIGVLRLDYGGAFFTAQPFEKYWIGVTAWTYTFTGEFRIFNSSMNPSPPMDQPMMKNWDNGWEPVFGGPLFQPLSQAFTLYGHPIFPEIVHEAGLPFPARQTRPHTGYIDPRRESGDGVHLLQGFFTAQMRFNTDVTRCDGSDINAGSFEISETGGGMPPSILYAGYADNDRTLIQVLWNRPLRLREWTTIRAVDVCNPTGPVANLGNLGPGVEEPDRVDFGFLPADVDQSGNVNPLDLLRFKNHINNALVPVHGGRADFVDTDRSGTITALDLLSFKQLINGVAPSTQAWAGRTMNHPQP